MHDFIKANPAQRHRLWVRIDPFDGPFTLGDLAAVMPRADVEKLDHRSHRDQLFETVRRLGRAGRRLVDLVEAEADGAAHGATYMSHNARKGPRAFAEKRKRISRGD